MTLAGGETREFWLEYEVTDQARSQRS